MNNWHEISREDDLPNVCEIVLVELQNGEKQVAQLDYNRWIRRLGWAIPNGNWIGEWNIPKRWMRIEEPATSPVRLSHGELVRLQYSNVDRCVFCGNIVPEGRMVCPDCEEGTSGV